MRMKLLLMMTCLTVFFTLPVFADSIAYRLSGGASSRCCAPPPPPPSPSCSGGPPYGCNCNDPGVYWNNCMSSAEYCAAFGNIGDSDICYY